MGQMNAVHSYQTITNSTHVIEAAAPTTMDREDAALTVFKYDDSAPDNW